MTSAERKKRNLCIKDMGQLDGKIRRLRNLFPHIGEGEIIEKILSQQHPR